MSNRDNPPVAGSGLHDWILDFTRKELAKGSSVETVREKAWKLTQRTGRRSTILRREIDDAVRGAEKWLADHPHVKAFEGNGDRAVLHWEEQEEAIGNEGICRPPPANKWQLPVDERLIAKILSRATPKLKPRTYFNLGELYAGYNFNICVAKEVNQPQARPLRFWQDRWSLWEIQWMVPNPFLKCGEGKGVKTDENAGERLWLIIEFDRGTLEEQAKLLMWLDRTDAEWELAMIVFSGSRSLHGWFSCVDKSEQEIFKFFRQATRLGCDRSMRSSVQYTRMPLGWNSKTDQRQQIVHWSNEGITFHNQLLIEYMNNEP